MKKNLIFLMLALIACAFGTRADELTVYEGTSTNGYVPAYLGYWDQFTRSQYVIPAADLENMNGCTINAIKFYTNTSNIPYAPTSTADVYLMEVDYTSISAFEPKANGTIVYQGTVSVVKNSDSTGGEMTIEFSTPYNYDGGNLLIGIENTTKNNYNFIYFLGQSVTGASIAGYNSSSLDNVSATPRNFIPQTTFIYENAAPVDYKASVSPNAIDFGKLAPNASASKTVTIKNKGTNAITPSLSGISAPFSTDYVSTTINGGDELTINVTFNPTEIGTYNQTLTIDCGYTDGIFNVALSGTSAKEITIADGTVTSEYLPIYGWNHGYYLQQNQFVYPASMMTSFVGKKLKSITFYPAEVSSGYSTYKGVNFYNGSVTISLASVEEGSITFTSSGNIAQSPEGLTQVGTITMPQIPQTNLTEWTITFGEEGYNYYGGDLLVDVTNVKGNDGRTYFYGITTDNYSGYYCSSSTAKTGSKFLPKATFSFEDAVAQVTVTPTELTFGGESFVIGNTDTKTFKVTNTTDEDVSLTLNDESGFFSIAPTTVVAGATNVTVTVTYAPNTADTHNATVTVGDKTVTLNGTAVDPDISGTVTPTELTFETYENVPATQTITIKNTGNTAFTPEFSGIEAPFSIEDATEIAAGESKDFVVTYAPTAIGTNNSTLTVDINGTTTNIALSGTATEVPPIVTVADDGISMSDSYGYSPIPVEGKYFDEAGTYGQTIYDKNDLTQLKGKSITKVKYYSNTTFDAEKIGGTVLEIYLMETEDDEIQVVSYSAQPLNFEGASAGEYTVVGDEKDVEFELTTPFFYSGEKNLAVQVRVKTASPQNSYQAIEWIGKAVNKWVSCYNYNSPTRSLTLPKTTFTYDNTITLADLCQSGKKEETYTIADKLLAVDYRTVGEDVFLWCKDDNKSIAKTEIQEGQIDFMEQQEEHSGEWDQSNWIVLKLNGQSGAKSAGEAKGHYIDAKTVTGTLVDAENYMLEVESEFTVGDDEVTYTPNVYCTSNFLASNLNVNGGQGGQTSGNPDTYYFFMNPKIQEICHITFAMWNGTKFTVPSTSGFNGELNVEWTYNTTDAGTPFEPDAETLASWNEKVFQFNAVVNKPTKSSMLKDDTEANNYIVYPLNQTGGEGNITTAINGVVAGNGVVKSVKYVNVAGIVSDRPFQGVNIVVTEYTDGTSTTSKVIM